MPPEGLKRLTIVSHVVHNDDPVSATVVRRSDGPEPFLSGGVPLRIIDKMLSTILAWMTIACIGNHDRDLDDDGDSRSGA